MKAHVNRAQAAVWWRRLWVMTAKEVQQLLRDPILLSFMVFVFTVNIYLQGSSVSLQLNRAAMVVQDGDHSAASRELIHRFRPPYFRLDGEVDSSREAIGLLDRGEVMVALDIPTGFQERLLKGESASVLMQVDATQSAQAFLATSYAARIVGQFGLEKILVREGLSSGSLEEVPVVIDDQRVWFNPNEKDTWFMPISEMLEAITLFSILLPAAAMVREKERGTIEQLMVSPLSPFQIMFPKVLAMTAVILFCMSLALFGVLGLVFQVPMRGSLPLFYVVTTLYIFANAGLGLFAATIARNLAQVGLLSLLILAPIILLSGTWTPPEAMPTWLRLATLASPLRHYIDASYGILLKGAGLDSLWDSVLAIGILGILIFSFGIRRFRRQFV
ncbi:MAG: ABC transporter permease [Burkholderiales bacterium]|jgi:ABC-2 type transport system permease protein|nr:MAG: ABC transporter permease [Burkholderiales bacterium]